MALYTEPHEELDISASAVVLTYTLTGTQPRTLVCRVLLGGADTPIAASGNYTIKVFLNSHNVAPNSAVLVDTGPAVVLQSREISLEPGDELRVEVIGRETDTAVNTQATLIDHTPVTRAELYGDGGIVVDHNYGGTDALAYKTAAGQGIDNAVVQAFLTSDWDAGRRGTSYIKGATTTNSRGRWVATLMLDPDVYTFVFFRQGLYGPNTQRVTVS